MYQSKRVGTTWVGLMGGLVYILDLFILGVIGTAYIVYAMEELP